MSQKFTTVHLISILSRIVVSLLALILILILAFPIGFYGMAMYIEPSLPKINDIKQMPLEMPLQIYTADNLLIGQYGNRYSLPITYDELPKRVEQAFLAAEDDTFFEHSGISVKGLGRAITQILTKSDDQTGGSTITQQVAKNYFLSAEQTFQRKLTEMYLARRIESQMTKDEIMTLYVNKIYLGEGAYGIKAAAKRYYSKSLENLTLAQAAMLAGLPKAPSAFNPVINPTRALQRRNWILSRMLENQYITQAEYNAAISEPIGLQMYQDNIDVDLPYISEMARTALVEKYGKQVMTSGWRVQLTIDAQTQLKAEQAVRSSLQQYTRDYGIKGSGIEEKSGDLNSFYVYDGMEPAQVLNVGTKTMRIKLKSGDEYDINKSAGVKEGNIIRVVATNKDKTRWQMKAAPKIQGALLSINPKNGALIAVVGGYSFYQNKFNRATQGYRQPGSIIKPLVYASAMEYKKMTPDSPISNEPHTRSWPKNAGSSGYSGFSTLRSALAVSYNTAAVNVLKRAGIEETRALMNNMGLDKGHLPTSLPLALGAGEATPLQMATAFSTFINGGHRIQPYLIERIYDFHSNVIYQANPDQSCAICFNSSLEKTNKKLLKQFEAAQKSDDTKDASDLEGNKKTDAKKSDDTKSDNKKSDDKTSNDSNDKHLKAAPPVLPAEYDAAASYDRLKPKAANQYLAAKQAPRIISPRVAYQMSDMLRTVVRAGTAKKALSLGRSDIGGKTGTTNQAKDVWFAGVNPNITTVVWMGFDTPRSLGAREYGGTRALPMWINFMSYALKDLPVEWVTADNKSKTKKQEQQIRNITDDTPINEPISEEPLVDEATADIAKTEEIIPEGGGQEDAIIPEGGGE